MLSGALLAMPMLDYPCVYGTVFGLYCLLIRANAKLVYACEWNPHAVEALQRNLKANSVSDRCILLEGDNRVTAPKGVADRVCLGLLPSSEGSWVTVVKAIRNQGGILHVHGNVKDSEERLWADHVLKSIDEIAKSEGHCWEVTIEHVHTSAILWLMSDAGRFKDEQLKQEQQQVEHP